PVRSIELFRAQAGHRFAEPARRFGDLADEGFALAGGESGLLPGEPADRIAGVHQRSSFPSGLTRARLLPESLHELDLARMVNVVQSGPRDFSQRLAIARLGQPAPQAARGEGRDDGAQRAVLAVEGFPLCPPRLLARRREVE